MQFFFFLVKKRRRRLVTHFFFLLTRSGTDHSRDIDASDRAKARKTCFSGRSGERTRSKPRIFARRSSRDVDGVVTCVTRAPQTHSVYDVAAFIFFYHYYYFILSLFRPSLPSSRMFERDIRFLRYRIYSPDISTSGRYPRDILGGTSRASDVIF